MYEKIIENSNLYKNIYSNSLIKNLEMYKSLDTGVFQNKYLNLFKSYKALENGTLQLSMKNNLLDYERITRLINNGGFQSQIATNAMKISKLHNHFTSKNNNEMRSLQKNISNSILSLNNNIELYKSISNGHLAKTIIDQNNLIKSFHNGSIQKSLINQSEIIRLYQSGEFKSHISRQVFDLAKSINKIQNYKHIYNSVKIGDFVGKNTLKELSSNIIDVNKKSIKTVKEISDIFNKLGNTNLSNILSPLSENRIEKTELEKDEVSSKTVSEITEKAEEIQSLYEDTINHIDELFNKIQKHQDQNRLKKDVSTPITEIATSLEILAKQINAIENEISKLFGAITQISIKLNSKYKSAVLTAIILPFIINLTSSFIDRKIQNYWAKTSLNSEGENVDLECLLSQTAIIQNFRIVTKKNLDVRQKPQRNNSAKIGVLFEHQIVLILEKRKDWAYIKLDDSDTGVQIKGWVFSRYLTKIK